MVHALDQLHIKALLGDQQCIVGDVNADSCYDTPKFMTPNIMGSGTALTVANAKPSLELIDVHTRVRQAEWRATMAVNQPPRKLPLNS